MIIAKRKAPVKPANKKPDRKASIIERPNRKDFIKRFIIICFEFDNLSTQKMNLSYVNDRKSICGIDQIQGTISFRASFCF